MIITIITIVTACAIALLILLARKIAIEIRLVKISVSAVLNKHLGTIDLARTDCGRVKEKLR